MIDRLIFATTVMIVKIVLLVETVKSASIVSSVHTRPTPSVVSAAPNVKTAITVQFVSTA